MLQTLTRRAASIVGRSRPRRTITLVIDDGPSAATADLLAALAGAGHRAVLFVLGYNISHRRAILVNAVRAGFALGNHSWEHPRFSQITCVEARASIEATEVLIENVYEEAGIARHGKWFRFPFLDTGDARSDSHQNLLRSLNFERPAALSKLMLPHDQARVDWPTTLNTHDFELPPANEMRSRLQSMRPGEIVEFHDKPETVGRYTALIIEELAKLGLTAVVPQAGRTSR